MRNPRSSSPNSKDNSLFEISRKNYLQSSDIWKVRADRKYIYVIFFNSNSTGLKPLPFYVGQSSNLVSRFSKHSELIWHQARFNKKAVIHVIASVPDTMADEAEKETIEALLSHRYKLNNVSLNKTLRSKPKDMDAASLKKYMRDFLHRDPYTVFEELQAKWLKKESTQKATVNIEAKQMGAPTSTDLYRAISTRSYPNNQAHGLSKALAKEYNPQTNASVHIFYSSSGKDAEKQLELVHKTISAMQGDWQLMGELRLDFPIIFVPTDGLENSKPSVVNFGRRPVHHAEVLEHKKQLQQQKIREDTKPHGSQPAPIDQILYAGSSNLKSRTAYRNPNELVQAVRVIKYKKPEASRISQMLALAYKSESGTSTFKLNKVSYRPRLKIMQEALNEIAKHWECLNPPTDFETNQKLIFRPTDLLNDLAGNASTEN